MYGKLFTSMYDGTLVSNWEALITFQQMIIIADDVGIVDITPHALSARTGIPLVHIQAGIKVLESDDEYSRSPEQNGRRIERLDSHRPWGWKIVNYMHYRNLASHEEKKKRDRDRINAKRNSEKVNDINGVAKCRKVSPVVSGVANVAHIDINTDEDKDIFKPKKAKKFIPPKLEEVRKYCTERNNSIDPANFIDHYEANGWVRGKTKIKCWKACVRTWERNSDNKKPENDYAI